uniref:STAGA complex 65 subunit gamma n=1 Tax=Lygus hesperus TaxID=30085 RepID=A0A146KST8_LYGHE
MNITVEEDVEPELSELHHHWGEISSPGPSPLPSIPPELEHGCMAIMRMKVETRTKMPIAEENYDPKTLELPPDDSLTTEILKHNIRLNKHIKEMSCLIKEIDRDPTKIKECPPLPVMAKCKRAERLAQQDVSDKQRLRSGRPQSIPAVVDDVVIQQMLEKAVIMILAQIGFDSVEKLALLVFVDVVKDMLYKVSLMSHELNQRDVIEGKSAYKDVLEKAFRSVGFSGLDCVKEYFKKTLLTKRKLAHQRSKQLMIVYSQKVAEISKRTGGVPMDITQPLLPGASSLPVPEYSPSTSASEPMQ